MSSDAERLIEANACHDTDPPRAAALLRDIDVVALPEADRPLFAFLLNHVLGEKLGNWASANARQAQTLAAAGSAAPAVLWRQAAVAAELGGDGPALAYAVAGLARMTTASETQAGELVRLAAASFSVPRADAADAGATALAALRALDAPHWQTVSALDAPAAASCNNLAAGLAERPLADLGVAALRAATLQAAQCSQRLWLRAGDWVNHERACYGLAVAAGAVGDARMQHDAAEQGLRLLDRHDAASAQNVDRAFLEQELAHALQRQGRSDEATAARARADALAAAFDDTSLAAWYGARAERQRALLG